jgi:GT2 family glycosyltransferase
VRAEAFERVGLLPERYFLYYEDIDFADRLREAGYQLVTATDTIVHHKESASSDGDATSAYYNERNRLLRAHDNGIDSTFVLLTIWRICLSTAISLLRRDFGVIRAILRGLWDGLRRVDGRGPYP